MIIAIIPAKGDSSRLPNKNMREIHGKPMMYYTIEVARKCQLIDEIYVSTDSKMIEAYARNQGVKVIRRGTELCGDTPILDVYRHALNMIMMDKQGEAIEYIIGMQPDHPDRMIDLTAAVRYMKDKGYDEIITVDRKGYMNGSLKMMRVDALVTNRLGTVGTLMDDCTNIHVEDELITASKNIKRRMQVLITAPIDFMIPMRNRLENKFDIIYGYQMTKEQLFEQVINPGRIDAIIPNPGYTYMIDKEFLEVFSGVKVIVTPSTGTNHIDMKYCQDMGITVRGLLDNRAYVQTITGSAEFTFALALSMMRMIPQSLDYVGRGHWRDKEDDLRGVELQGKTFGIVGHGRIGKKVENYLKVFEPKCIHTYDKQHSDKALETLLADSDMIFICVTLEDDTYQMVDKRWFNKMKDGVYFVNTSRGEIVVEDDLIDAIESGKIQRAAVDVVCDEANYKENKLIEYANASNRLLVTPHIAGATVEGQTKAMDATLETLERIYNV